MTSLLLEGGDNFIYISPYAWGMASKNRPLPTLEMIAQRRDVLDSLSHDELDELKRLAGESREAVSYLRIMEALGEEPELDELSRGYEASSSLSHPEQEKAALESLIRFSEENRIPKDFGLDKKNYLTPLDKETVTTLWYGMNNLDIPVIMLAAMEPGNILTKYYMGGQKRQGHLPSEEFGTLCKDMNHNSYFFFRSPVKRKIPISYWKRHYGTKERERLSLVPEKDQSSFLASYRAPHLPSKREDSMIGNDYDLPEGHHKEWYADRFMEGIKRKYQSLQEKIFYHGLTR